LLAPNKLCIRFEQQGVKGLNMLDLVDPITTVAPEHLATPGGFAWWYADLLDANGSGAVFIWSFGLPFLPGVLSRARDGRGQRATDRPALFLSVFERGVPAFQMLEEYTPDSVTIGDGSWTFGSSRIRLAERGAASVLSAVIDCDLPGTGRVDARLDVAGARRVPGSGEPAAGAYHWTPLTSGATGRLSLRGGGVERVIDGGAYVDRNSSASPIDRLGFSSWSWGRAYVGDTLMIWYVSWPEGGGGAELVGLQVRPDGTTERVSGLRLEVHEVRRTRWTMPRPVRVVLANDAGEWLSMEEGALVDDSPFYARQTVRVRGRGGVGTGIAEACVPARIDGAVTGWMASLCVSRGGEASMWHPLFSGPARGRWARLLGRAAPAAARAATGAA
jgi:hypothetical protein